MPTRRLMSLAAILCALPLGAQAAPPLADGPNAGDPWKGKSRHDVTVLLGEPTKTKKNADGEILEYKLFRVKDDAAAGAEIVLLEVPGVGWVASPIHAMDPADPETLSIEPTTVDRDGRPVGGGVQTTVSRSVSWDSKTGEVTRPDSPADRPALKKVKLTFELDRGATVVDWSVAPKQ